MTGQVLRYKILVFDFAIRAVLYNNGTTIEPIAFDEVKIDTNQFYSFGANFCKIQSVPLAMLTYPDAKFVETLAS